MRSAWHWPMRLSIISQRMVSLPFLSVIISKWKQEYADLKEQRDTDYTKLKATRAEVAELQKIRKCVDIALRADQPEQTQNRAKRHEQER